jgi:hypothetical protein
MTPQPILRVNPNATFRAGFGSAREEHPDLYHLVMQTISMASYGEQMWAGLFVTLLRSSPKAAFASYYKLEAASARKAILLAAAKEVVMPEDYLRLLAVIKAIKPAIDTRNKFAHHLWGDSPEIPDALVLANPESWTQMHVDGALSFLGPRPPPGEEPEIIQDLSATFVWNRAALKSAVETMTRAVTSVGMICELLSLNDSAAHARPKVRERLKIWPTYVQAFESIRRQADAQSVLGGLP